ncbi:formimidoylglutamase [Dongshaea marina]|uniref:formimidoylglutamase n=1 Tax=Dongshaea marina TaxID=2047966 RepID=UPI000D3E9685|nr:formimidoylglutamase [Dongshaea marina]
MTDNFVWQGRIDQADGPKALRWHQRITPWTADAPPGFTLLGFCCDEGVRRNQGRPGAAGGPNALRQVLASQPWHQEPPIYDAGNIECHDGDLALAQQQLGERVSLLLKQQHRPLVIGGGHEVALGSWLGLSQALAGQQIGIINFDAHFDLRSDAEGASSGTPFYQIAQHCQQRQRPFHYLCLGISQSSNTQALFLRAAQLGAHYVLDEAIDWDSLNQLQAEIIHFIDSVDSLYLSIDLDVFPAAIAPGVSAPACRGVELALIEKLLSPILSSPKLCLSEIAELNPLYDPQQQTTRLAARLIHLITRSPGIVHETI